MKKLSVMALSTLLSASLILSCQKKEETSTETEQSQQETISQPTQQPEQQQTQQETVQQPEQKPVQKEEQPVQQQQPAEKQVANKTTETKAAESKKVEEKKSEEKTVAKVDGESIFKSKGCTACHQAAADTVGPSLKKIAATYSGKKEDLVKFLSGEGKAIVDPAKEAIMKPQLEVTKKLSKEEKEALADFILKH